MNVVLVIIVICVSYLIVRIGAIALEMTGIERSMAQFQSLSAFSGTGFNTKDTEKIVHHSIRRRIVSILMILGNAGIVSVIATIVLTFANSDSFHPSMTLMTILISLFILYQIVIHQEVAKQLTEKIREILWKKFHIERVLLEEVVKQPEGYGVTSISIIKDLKIANLTLKESGLNDGGLKTLSIERDDQLITAPKGTMKLQAGDRLICYGKFQEIDDLIR